MLDDIGTWAATVFPTPVGMVRIKLAATVESRGFPHARGDGPDVVTIQQTVAVVFPTPVGMVRVPTRGRGRR